MAALGALALAAHAQDNTPPNEGPPPGGPNGGPGPGMGQRPPMPAIVRALDANHDGVIDATEISNASTALKALDKDGDGKLSMQEVMGPRPQMNGPRGQGRGPRNGPGGQGPDGNAPGDDGNLPPNGPPPGDGDNGAPPAGGPPQGSSGPGMRPHHPPLPLVVRTLDANHDGVIDASELANAPAALKSLDKDGDGKLSMQETMGPRPQMGRGPGGGEGMPPSGPPGEGDGGNPPPDGPPGEN